MSAIHYAATNLQPCGRNLRLPFGMAYCSSCGEAVEDTARFCAGCGRAANVARDTQLPARTDSRPALGLDDVPWCLGWLGIPVAILVPLVGLALYSYWGYRRGRSDGMGREPTDAPYPAFWSKVVIFAVILLVPLVGLLSVIGLPTHCYKQGLRVGAKERAAPKAWRNFDNPATSNLFTPETVSLS